MVQANGTEAWLVVRYQEARAALNHPDLLKDPPHAASEPQTQDPGTPASSHPPFGRRTLIADPPDHDWLRKPAAKTFTPQRIQALRPRVQEIADELLDALPATGRADLIDTFAVPLSMQVICEILGVPFLDQERFRAWSHQIVSPDAKDDAPTKTDELTLYLHTLVQEKRARPGEDLFSKLIRISDEDEDTLSTDDLAAAALTLLLAGHETTANLIATGTYTLLRHPDQLKLLRSDWSLIDNAVEEMLRYDGPAEGTTVRYAARDVELGGTVVPADGTEIHVMLAAADRDPERFEAPDNFDVRRNTGGHIAFGHGIHFCLGAALARLEARVALHALLERFPELKLDADPTVLTWRPGLLIRGLHHLPVRYS
ncbi:cytochrome P450 [Streptomyces sp. NPDC127051]|uniref:cytochrome P450 family protein n=1 Tax=Streptomyces sp. NPDC127051 TaxID=3347119 RepID=UPI00365A5DCC